MELKSQQQSVDRLKQLWRWWVDELREAAPAPVVRFFAKQSAILSIDVEQHIARFQLHREKSDRLLGTLDLLGCTERELQVFLDDILFDLPAGLTVNVTLSRDQLLSSDQYLPLATEANLSNVLGFEIDRLTPFPRDQVVFGYQIAGRYPEREKVHISLYALPRKSLDQLLARLQVLGLKPETILPATSGADPSLNLLPVDIRPAVEPLWNPRAKKLGWMVVALMAALLLYPLFQLNQQMTSLQEAVAEVREPATVVGNKQSMLASRLAAQDTLVMRKNHEPSKLAIVQEVTSLMPDNTWVSRLRVSGGDVNLQGESRKASDLIEILEQSEQFQNVQFVSPITANPSTNMERYEIKMELVGGIP